MRVSEEKTYSRILYPVLLLVTAFSIYLRLFYGWDQDESYVTFLAYRISKGDRLFYDLLDLHQTGAILPALFCKIYIRINGNTDGLGLFLRCISAAIQMVLSGYLFAVLKRIAGMFPAFCASVVAANMLPRATQQMEYSTVAIWGAIVANLLLLDRYYDEERYDFKVILAAFFYSISVLAYPTMLISVPVYVVFFIKYHKGGVIKELLLYFLTCGVLALAFCVYVISCSSVSEFGYVLKLISNSGDHAGMFAFLFNADFLARPIFRVGATIGVAVLLSILVNKIIDVRIKAFYYYVALTTFAVIFLNLTGMRPSGPYGFLERYIGTVILAVPILRKSGYKPVMLLFFIDGILYYVGALMGSNLGANENAMYLELAVIAAVIFASLDLGKLERVAIVFFLLGIAFSAGYFVRVRYTEPANFTQCTSRFESGPLKGIYVKKDQFEEVSAKADFIDRNSKEDKIYAVLTNDPIYNYYIRGDISAAGFAPTSNRNYNELWINYYVHLHHEIPDTIFADTYWYSNIDDFCATDFGKWVKASYDVKNSGDGEFRILDR